MHDEHVTDEDHIPYFNKKDKDFEALQKIVLNAKWLESLQHYVRFRWVEVVILITTIHVEIFANFATSFHW